MNAVIDNMPAAEYHAHPAVSNSTLKHLPDDPETFWAWNVAKPRPSWCRRKEVTRAMELGTAFHTMLLEGLSPPVVPEDILASNGAMTTTAAKKFKADHPDYLKRDEHDDLCYCVDRCRADAEIRAFLDTPRRAEVSLFWDDTETGIECRGRLDSLCTFQDGLWIFDLKFAACNPNDQDAIGWKIFDMGYERQAAFYTDAVQALIGPVAGFVFCFVRNSPPHDAYLWQVSENDLDMGRRHNREALIDLQRRREADDWHTPRFQTLSMTQLPRRAWERPTEPATPFSEFQQFERTA